MTHLDDDGEVATVPGVLVQPAPGSAVLAVLELTLRQFDGTDADDLVELAVLGRLEVLGFRPERRDVDEAVRGRRRRSGRPWCGDRVDKRLARAAGARTPEAIASLAARIRAGRQQTSTAQPA